MEEDKDVTKALRALKKAWRATCADYGQRKLNGERALQAALYYRLRPLLERLSPDYRLFVEARVTLPEVAADKTSGTVASDEKNIVVDTLICKDRDVLVAIELKYTPRGFPQENDVRKDLKSLSEIRNHAAKKRQVTIELVRHREAEQGDRMTLRVSPSVRMVLGVYCKDRQDRMSEKTFWERHKPKTGPWKSRRELPPRLGLCLAYALDPKLERDAEGVFMGQPLTAEAGPRKKRQFR